MGRAPFGIPVRGVPVLEDGDGEPVVVEGAVRVSVLGYQPFHRLYGGLGSEVAVRMIR